MLLFLKDDPTFLDDNPQGFYQVVGICQGKFTVGSDGVASNSGHVIVDGLRVGEIEFKLNERTAYRNLVLPGVVVLLSLGAVYLFYRARVSS